MARIEIIRCHQRSYKKAIKLIKNIAVELAQNFNTNCDWNEENSFSFQHMGSNAVVSVDQEAVRIDMRLSVLVAPMKGMISHKIEVQLDRLLK